jgi:hypothetical protein
MPAVLDPSAREAILDGARRIASVFGFRESVSEVETIVTRRRGHLYACEEGARLGQAASTALCALPPADAVVWMRGFLARHYGAGNEANTLQVTRSPAPCVRLNMRLTSRRARTTPSSTNRRPRNRTSRGRASAVTAHPYSRPELSCWSDSQIRRLRAAKRCGV